MKGFAHRVVGWALCLCLVASLAASQAVSPLTISGYQKVSEARVGRTDVRYVYRVQVSNTGVALSGVIARVTSRSSSTVIIEGVVDIGSLAASSSVTSLDTFTMQQNRSVPFNPADLQWSFDYEIAPPANSPPSANAGIDQTVALGVQVQLDGTGSTDPDGDQLSYSWEFVSRPQESGAALADPVGPMPTFIVDRPGEYIVGLLVSDGEDLSALDTVRISTSNSAPIANAGPDQTVALGSLVQLDGSASSDPDGDALSYAWALTSLPASSTATLSNATSGSPTFVVDRPGNYVVSLTVSDGVIASAADLTVVATQNSAPVANAGEDRAAFVDDTVTLDGSQSSDVDGDALSYSWALITRPDGSTAVLNAANTPITTFVPDEAGLYVAQLIVNDGALDSEPDTARVMIEVRAPVDTDGDGLSDERETQLGTNPNDADSDDDGLSDGQEVNTYNTNPLDADSDDDTLSDGDEVNQYGTNPNARDTDGDTFDDSEELSSGSDPRNGQNTPAGALPVDPRTAATPFNTAGLTRFVDQVSFLYSGTNPIQRNVTPGAIDGQRVAVLRGRVLDRNLSPLAGVAITLNGAPQYGHTLTRSDGRFDIAVNGGSQMVVDYRRTGFLPLQRAIDTSSQQHASLPDVVMIELDERSTQVTLTGATVTQVHQSSPSVDADGTRQATLLFNAGTTATMVMPDGSTQPLTSLTVRATEYTVGPNGPRAMPAVLPGNSGYTYAVELSVDEAIVAGARDVLFSQPVINYVENFLGFPVGLAVPTAYYDRVLGCWVPAPNGRVIELLGVTGDLAELDTNGDRVADTPAVLAAFGISVEERRQIASLYPAGTAFWRVPVNHFTPWDHNFPYAPPPDAEPPGGDPDDGNDDDDLDEPYGPDETEADPTEVCGSVVECENQVLRESIPIDGTPWRLNYSSDRARGRNVGGIVVPLTAAELPPSLRGIEVELQLAGRVFTQSFAVTPNRSFRFEWDGVDVWGRAVRETQTAIVRVGYIYDGVYQVPAAFASSFAQFSGIPLTALRSRQQIMLSRTTTVAAPPSGAPDPATTAAAVGGWSIDGVHFMDFASGTLFLGDGTRRKAIAVGADAKRVVGTGVLAFSAGEGTAGILTTTDAGNFSNALAISPAGELYFAEGFYHRIRRIRADGAVETVVGTGAAGFSGEGVVARTAQISFPSALAFAPDGTLSFIEQLGSQTRARRVELDGRITTITGVTPGGQLTPEANCCFNFLLNNVLQRRGADGIARPVSGTPIGGNSRVFLDVPASRTQFSVFEQLSVRTAPSGEIYIGITPGLANALYAPASFVVKIGNDGILRHVAGQLNTVGYSGDGGPARDALLNGAADLAFDNDGNLYIADRNNRRVRRVDTQGIITTVAGTGAPLAFGVRADLEGKTALGTNLGLVTSIAVNPESRAIYVADATAQSGGSWGGERRILRFGQALPQSAVGELLVPSADATQGFVFDPTGHHLRTINLKTNATVATMTYDGAGRLQRIDTALGAGLVVSRDAGGRATGISSAEGVQTTLTENSAGLLERVVRPNGGAFALEYQDDSGLLTRFENPRGFAATAEYDGFGRLVRHPEAVGGIRLTRTGSHPSQEVTLTTTENRVRTYATEVRPDGSTIRRTGNADGTTTVVERAPGQSEVRQLANGTVVRATNGTDPRFGAVSPLVADESTTTPSGLSKRVLHSRTVSLSNPTNPLSLVQQVDTRTINGRPFTSTYNASAREAVSRSPLGRTRTTVLNATGRVAQVRIPGRANTDYSYDASGRLTTITQGPRLTQFEYDSRGYLSSLTDPANRTVRFTRDASGRVLGLRAPDDREVLFGFQPNGNLRSITPPNRPAHLFDFTPVDLMETYRAPDVGDGENVTRIERDLDKAIELTVLPDGREIDPAYDAAGRLSSLTIDRGEYRYAYSATTGQLASITSPEGGVTTNVFDGPLLVAQSWSGTISGSVSRTFDNNFKVTSIAVNGANAVALAYDNDGLLTQAGSLTLARDALNGSLSGSTLGSITDEYGYDAFGDVTSYTTRFGSTVLFQAAYTRDLLGRITRSIESEVGVTRTIDYTYDLAGRLETVRRNGTLISTYSYDSNGNRLSHTSPTGTIGGVYDAQDRLAAYGTTTYSYSAGGQLGTKIQGGQATNYQYDELGNLLRVELETGTTIEYVIDGLNRRIGRRENGVLRSAWLYKDSRSPVAELDGAGNVVSVFVYGKRADVPDYMVRAGQTLRLISDELGSVRLVVNASSGEVVQRIQYDEFGVVLADSNPGFQPFGFGAGLWDSTVGLLRLGKRDYMPSEGRFTAKDPLLFSGGQVNLYTYAHNNPVTYIDSGGTQPTTPDSSQQPQGPCQGFWCEVARGIVGGLTGGGAFEREFGDPPAAELSNIIGCALAQYATGALICAERGNLAGIPESDDDSDDSPAPPPACNPLFQSCPRPEDDPPGGMCPLPPSQAPGPSMSSPT